MDVDAAKLVQEIAGADAPVDRELQRLDERDRIPFVDLTAQYDSLQPQIEEALVGIARGGRYVLGPPVQEFEHALAEYAGCRFAVGVASGTDALVLALNAAGVAEGQEVITSSFSFFATASAIIRAGARPVFVDIDSETFNLSPKLIQSATTKRTAAVVPVHLFGLAAGLPEIRQHFDGPVVADGAQAIGARHDGTPVASLALATSLSFFPTKNLGGLGDGGAVLTDDPAVAEHVDLLRRHGAVRKYEHTEVGLNSRLDAVQAAVLLVKLRALNEWTNRRRELASRYSAALVALSFLRVPVAPPEAGHVFHQYTVRVQDGMRDRLATFLKARHIETAVNYPIPLHLQSALAHLGYRPGDLPVAEAAAQEVLSLPCFPELRDSQQDAVIEAILDFVAHS